MKTIGLILIVSAYIVWANDDTIEQNINDLNADIAFNGNSQRLNQRIHSTITSTPFSVAGKSPERRKGKFLGLLGLVAGLNLIDGADDDEENNFDHKTFDIWDEDDVTRSPSNLRRSSKIAFIQKNGRFELIILPEPNIGIADPYINFHPYDTIPILPPPTVVNENIFNLRRRKRPDQNQSLDLTAENSNAIEVAATVRKVSDKFKKPVKKNIKPVKWTGRKQKTEINHCNDELELVRDDDFYDDSPRTAGDALFVTKSEGDLNQVDETFESDSTTVPDNTEQEILEAQNSVSDSFSGTPSTDGTTTDDLIDSSSPKGTTQAEEVVPTGLGDEEEGNIPSSTAMSDVVSTLDATTQQSNDMVTMTPSVDETDGSASTDSSSPASISPEVSSPEDSSLVGSETQPTTVEQLTTETSTTSGNRESITHKPWPYGNYNHNPLINFIHLTTTMEPWKGQYNPEAIFKPSKKDVTFDFIPNNPVWVGK